MFFGVFSILVLGFVWVFTVFMVLEIWHLRILLCFYSICGLYYVLWVCCALVFYWCTTFWIFGNLRVFAGFWHICVLFGVFWCFILILMLFYMLLSVFGVILLIFKLFAGGCYVWCYFAAYCVLVFLCFGGALVVCCSLVYLLFDVSFVWVFC